MFFWLGFCFLVGRSVEGANPALQPARLMPGMKRRTTHRPVSVFSLAHAPQTSKSLRCLLFSRYHTNACTKSTCAHMTQQHASTERPTHRRMCLHASLHALCKNHIAHVSVKAYFECRTIPGAIVQRHGHSFRPCWDTADLEHEARFPGPICA